MSETSIQNHYNLNLESSLCFPKDIFYANNFDVDSFISHYKREYSLERVRDDLNIFLKVLEMSMSDLINKDYPDFVNLSTNLVDLDKAINELKKPLETIKTDVDNVKNSIDSEIELIMNKLNEKLMIEKRRIVLKLLINWQRSLKVTNEMIGHNTNTSKTKISGDHVERIAFEFCQLKNSLSICSGETQESSDLNKLSEMLEQIMQDLFIACLSDNFKLNTETKTQLKHVLKSYTLLSKQNVLEQIYSEHFVKAYMQEYINETYLESNILKLNGVYEKILEFFDLNSEFLRLSNNEFELLINSIWSQVVKALDFNLNSIFSPADPDLFHSNFLHTLDFLNKFEQKCCNFDKEFKKKFQNCQLYKYFIKKWPVQVYYQIRFQEIVLKFEQELFNYDKLVADFEEDESSNLFYLNISDCLVKQLEYTWLEQTCFLKCLLSQFWKLNLQLISRYCTFFMSLFKSKLEQQESNKEQAIQLAVYLLSDANKLYNFKLYNFFDGTIAPIIRASHANKEISLLKETFSLSIHNLNELKLILLDYITKVELEKCLANLRNANDIPRLYRRTNRDVPKSASIYVQLSVDTIVEFKNLYLNKCGELIDKCVLNIIDSICIKYQALSSDLLESVRKMEDSLKRLQMVKKNRNSQSQNNMLSGQSSMLSDDDKIRLQLYLDIVEFGRLLELNFNGYKGETNYDALFKLVQDLSSLQSSSSLSSSSKENNSFALQEEAENNFI